MSKILVIAEHSLSDQVADHVERQIGRSDLERVYTGTISGLIEEFRKNPERYEFTVLPNLYTHGCEYALSIFFDLQEARHDIEIVGCVPVVPSLYLWGVPGAALGDVRVVCSHLEALSTCRVPLRDLGIIRAEYDVSHTAAGAREVAARGCKGMAALASRYAGEAYGLVRLLDEPLNPREMVPFFLLGREPISFASAYNRTVVAIHNRPDLALPALRLELDLERLFTLRTEEVEWLILQLRGDLQTGGTRSQVREIEAIAGEDYEFLGSYWMWDPIQL